MPLLFLSCYTLRECLILSSLKYVRLWKLHHLLRQMTDESILSVSDKNVNIPVNIKLKTSKPFCGLSNMCPQGAWNLFIAN